MTCVFLCVRVHAHPFTGNNSLDNLFTKEETEEQGYEEISTGLVS